MYRNVLTKLRPALHDVEELMNAPRFHAAKHFHEWQQFISLARIRLDKLKYLDSPDHTPSRACDNRERVNVPIGKGDTTTCALCFILWKGIQFTRNERFLRELVHLDYVAERSEIFFNSVVLLAHDPDMPLCVAFDYTAGRVVIEVRRGLAGFAAAHRGQMEVHSVIMNFGGRTVSHAFRLQFSHPGVHDALVGLAVMMAPQILTQGPLDPYVEATIRENVRDILEIPIETVYHVSSG
ncbi:hypothetical protein C8R43DRAFT_1210814 [Mycena crocata]|nr:hypothetical protein C8R43DRAFT_1210814 [Mycena crocata]